MVHGTRRQFISLLGGAAAVCPLAARAQQPERMRRVGVLIGSDDNPEARTLFAEFQQGLEQLGWSYGQTVQIDIRWGSDPERIIAYTKELVRLSPDVFQFCNKPSPAAVCPWVALAYQCSGSDMRHAPTLS